MQALIWQLFNLCSGPKTVNFFMFSHSGSTPEFAKSNEIDKCVHELLALLT